MATDMITTQAQFALDLMRSVSSSDEVAFLSPVSISIAMAMTFAGADGNTKRQIQDIMFGGLSDDKIHSSFGDLSQWLSKSRGSYKLYAANRMYVQKDLQMLPKFLTTLTKCYRSQLDSVDFKKSAGSVTNAINKWVSEITKNRINDLLGHGVLNSRTRLVLVNAIYFKAKWLHPFKKLATESFRFHSSPTSEKEVEMMYKKRKFLYALNDDVQVLGLPYRGGDLRMFVFLPNDRFGLSKFENELSGEYLLSMIRSAEETKVHVYFPNFRVEQSFDLSKALSGMGMNDLFDKYKADLSQITKDKKLYVSAVIHKAFIEVNELGTEAAAATGDGTSCCLSGELELDFVADHPFLFLINDKDGHILFLGRFV